MMDILSSPVANAVSATLIHFLWQGLLVAFGYWAVHQAFGIPSARIRYVTALVAMIVMTACPLLTFSLVSHNQAAASQISASFDHELMTESQARPASEKSTSKRDEEQSISTVSFTPEGTEDSAAEEAFLKSSSPYLLLFWLAGVTLSGVRLLAGLLNVICLRWGRTEISDGLARRSQCFARRLGLRTARVFASTSIREAAVVGFWRPVVLLPACWVSSLPLDILEAVIAHELAHIRRYDVWINLLQRIVETLLFYHPAVWWLSNRIRLERELCCDELAVEVTGERVAYVSALEQIGRLQLGGTLSLVTSFTGNTKMKLLHRVKNVLKVSGPTERDPAWLVGLVAVIVPITFFVMNGFPTSSNILSAQDRETGRSAEAERGPRRSAEAEAGPRRSPEAEAGPRRSPEAERGPARSAEGDGRRDAPNRLQGFRPQTQREAALYQMILQLQNEMAELRREVRGGEETDRSKSASRESASPRGDARRDGDSPQLSSRWKYTKEGRVFRAYDKNNDEYVSLDEWLAMTNGNVSPERRKIQTKRYQEADPDGDGKFTPAEFIQWYKVGRFETTEGQQRGPRDGEGVKTGPRDGEGVKQGPRDGEGTRRGPRDGEGTRTGPRDGE